MEDTSYQVFLGETEENHKTPVWGAGSSSWFQNRGSKISRSK
jgi:hypothetical protein